MISPFRSYIALSLLLLVAVPAAATSQEQALKALGALNGAALQCRYMDEMHRIKDAVVTYVPRTRSMGILFEEATSESYLALIREESACPPREKFAREVDDAIEALAAAFKPAAQAR